jgi:hypothetical protein
LHKKKSPDDLAIRQEIVVEELLIDDGINEAIFL